jgi:hypothetical protein
MTVYHATHIPFPNDDGSSDWHVTAMRTWCGKYAVDMHLERDNFAVEPQAVTCAKCKEAMRLTLKNLKEWVPYLE